MIQMSVVDSAGGQHVLHQWLLADPRPALESQIPLAGNDAVDEAFDAGDRKMGGGGGGGQF